MRALAILLGAAMLDETLSFTLFGGFVLVVAGIVLSNLDALRRPRGNSGPAS